MRNDLLLLFGNQKYDGRLHARGQGDSCARDALDRVRNVVASAGGKPEHVEAVYFTSFVMQ